MTCLWVVIGVVLLLVLLKLAGVVGRRLAERKVEAVGREGRRLLEQHNRTVRW